LTPDLGHATLATKWISHEAATEAAPSFGADKRARDGGNRVTSANDGDPSRAVTRTADDRPVDVTGVVARYRDERQDCSGMYTGRERAGPVSTGSTEVVPRVIPVL